MKKRNMIMRAAVAAALVSAYGAANAGSITLPAAATKYAAEALTAATAVTTPAVTYAMGVNRAIGQDFTMIFKPSAGATLTPANCVAANFNFGGMGATGAVFTFSTKRASASECAMQVAVTGGIAPVGATVTTTNAAAALVLATQPLATAGSSVSYTVGLWDLGETARIDNSTDLTVAVATSVNAVNVYAAAGDTATVADVNGVDGPLKDFLANATAPADTNTVAAANLTFDNNSVNAKIADGTTNFDFTGTAGTTTVVLTDANKSFSALAAGKLCLDRNANSTYCEAGEAFAAPVGTSATLAAITSAAFPVQGTTGARAVSFQADTLTSLGTSRTFAVGGTVTPAVGTPHAFADTASKNSSWWTWSANAIELWSPYFSTNSAWISRFAFQNIGIAVGYTATCLAETGNVVTNGAAVTGTLNPGMTMINASDICTFSGASRGNIRFVINAPAGNIHGTYNLVNAATGSSTVSELTRPFAAATW